MAVVPKPNTSHSINQSEDVLSIRQWILGIGPFSLRLLILLAFCYAPMLGSVLAQERGIIYPPSIKFQSRSNGNQKEESTAEKVVVDESNKDLNAKDEVSAAAKKKSALIQEGVIAFQQHCVECHDAQRSLSEDKSLVDWRATVNRMSEMDDADIPSSKHEAIAVYLASIGTGGKKKSNDDDVFGSKGSGAKKETANKDKDDTKLDQALVESGKTAFDQYCTTCHDAEKSFQASKDLAGWRSNVLRMAQKDGANIPQSSHEAIATYLTSLSKSGSGSTSSGKVSAVPSSVSITGTVSPWFRGGGSSNLEFPGFFGDVWIGAAYQNESPVSVRATACNSCHNQGSQIGRFDLVEATIRFDLTKQWNKACGTSCPINASVQAGRFIVPFGAYYQQSNPGVDRAVTRPLIYNMGQRVYQSQLGTQVLPMPYSDEGASFNLSVPWSESVSTTFDAYVVNGLEGNAGGVDFYASRDYVDNNRTPSLGGRFTVGNKYLRLGSSLIGGQFSNDAGVGVLNQAMNYSIFGLDATFRWEDIWRVQWEYAQRDSDRFGNIPSGPTLFQERFSGGYIQSELLLSRRKKVSLFMRYDTQVTHSQLAPQGSPLPTGDFMVDRATYGLNWTLPGGSLLMTDIENWRLPGPFENVNVFGIRWAATF